MGESLYPGSRRERTASGLAASRSQSPCGKNEGARNRSLWRLDRGEPQVARIMHRPVQFPNASASRLAACIFRCAGDGASSCLESRDSSASQFMNLRVTPHLLFCDASESLMRPRVAPHSASSGSADGEFTVARALAPPAAPWRMAPRVASHSAPSGGANTASTGCPISCSFGWDDLTPRLKTNLASPARPRMNLRFLPAPAHSRLALDVILIEPGTPLPSPAGERRARSCIASSCQGGTAFPIPWRPPTDDYRRPVESVDTSAKQG